MWFLTFRGGLIPLANHVYLLVSACVFKAMTIIGEDAYVVLVHSLLEAHNEMRRWKSTEMCPPSNPSAMVSRRCRKLGRVSGKIS